MANNSPDCEGEYLSWSISSLVVVMFDSSRHDSAVLRYLNFFSSYVQCETKIETKKLKDYYIRLLFQCFNLPSFGWYVIFVEYFSSNMKKNNWSFLALLPDKKVWRFEDTFFPVDRCSLYDWETGIGTEKLLWHFNNERRWFTWVEKRE